MQALAKRGLEPFKALDQLHAAGFSLEEETLEFLVCNRVNLLWQQTLQEDDPLDVRRLRRARGGVYFQTIRSRFLEEYDQARALLVPPGYAFSVNGKLAIPNLMQRLTALRIKNRRR